MNNAKYIALAEEVIFQCTGKPAILFTEGEEKADSKREFYSIRAEYVKAYTLGDSIFPRVAIEEDRTVVAFYNQDKELCCHVEIRKIQTLKILREKDFGVFVGEEGGDSVLLPIRQVPKGKTIGDEVSVFLYKDSKDRLIATTKKPYLEVGEIGRLRVSDVNTIGAFVDIGLEKDILVPHREMRYALKKDMEVEIYLYVDKTERLAGTMYTKKKRMPSI